MGWLASTIKNESVSRGQRFIDADRPLPLIELGGGDYLLDLMQQLGPIRSTGMGLTTPDWQELAAFARASGLALAPWENRLIKQMCGAYLREFNAGREPLCMPPIEREAD